MGAWESVIQKESYGDHKLSLGERKRGEVKKRRRYGHANAEVVKEKKIGGSGNNVLKRKRGVG